MVQLLALLFIGYVTSGGHFFPLWLNLLIYKVVATMGVKITVFLAPYMLSTRSCAWHIVGTHSSLTAITIWSLPVLMRKPLQWWDLWAVQSHMVTRKVSDIQSTLLFCRPLYFTLGSIMGGEAGPQTSMMLVSWQGIYWAVRSLLWSLRLPSVASGIIRISPLERQLDLLPIGIENILFCFSLIR